jgi:hypothetical protein
MELVLFIVGLCLFGILAARFGYDSRAVPYSPEHEMARLGLVWEVHAAARMDEFRRDARVWRLAQEAAAPGRSMRVRRRVATALRAFALWLSPELRPTQVRSHEANWLVTFRAPRP